MCGELARHDSRVNDDEPHAADMASCSSSDDVVRNHAQGPEIVPGASQTITLSGTQSVVDHI